MYCTKLNVSIWQENVLLNVAFVVKTKHQSARWSGHSQAFPIMPWVLQSVESNCGAWLWKLWPPRSREVIVAHVCITSEQVGIKSDTNLTSMHCAAIAADRFCADLTNLKRPYCFTVSWSILIMWLIANLYSKQPIADNRPDEGNDGRNT